jgi:hypothetical protein
VGIFSCVFWSFEFLLLRKLCLVQLPIFFICLLSLGEFSFLSSLYILVTSPFCDIWLASIFSHSVGDLFSLVVIYFVLQKLFNFMNSHLSILSVSC